MRDAWFDRQMEALEPFEVTVTFCFTPEHLGIAAASHQPAAGSRGVRRFLRAHDRALRTPLLTQGGRRMSLHDPKRTDINVALVGVGNCASSLVQGIAHYSNGGANEQIGLMHWDLGGYRPKDLEDRRRLGHRPPQGRPRCRRSDLRQAQLHRRVLRPRAADRHEGADGQACSTASPSTWPNFPDDRTFLLADADASRTRKKSSRCCATRATDVMVNYLPVGSQQATRILRRMRARGGRRVRQLHPGVHRQRPGMGGALREAGVPIIGDDIKAQLGATIVHRVLTDLFDKRGVKLDRTYQLNTGGNTDFLNMLEPHAAGVEEESARPRRCSRSPSTGSSDDNIHVGP